MEWSYSQYYKIGTHNTPNDMKTMLTSTGLQDADSNWGKNKKVSPCLSLSVSNVSAEKQSVAVVSFFFFLMTDAENVSNLCFEKILKCTR